MKRPSGLSVDAIALALSPVPQSVQDEEHKVREWQSSLRMLAGGRDGQRAIDWATEKYKREFPLTVGARLSGYLEHTYNRLARGDELGTDGVWRSRTPPVSWRQT